MEELNNFEENEQKQKYLTFKVGDEYYGIDISMMSEIIGIQKITEIPDVPSYIQGVINLRGTIVPIMDMRLKLKKDFKEYNEKTCILVINIQEIVIGLIVDQVVEVVSLSKEEIIPPPEITMTYNNRYVSGIAKTGKGILLLLYAEKLLTDEEVENLANINE